MTKYIFSPGRNLFYPTELRSLYKDWPSDGIEIEDSIFDEFTGEDPEGKIRGVGEDGLPMWVELQADDTLASTAP